MDDDTDGLISSQKIDITSLSNTVIDILTPILLEIEDRNLILDFS